MKEYYSRGEILKLYNDIVQIKNYHEDMLRIYHENRGGKETRNIIKVCDEIILKFDKFLEL